MHRIMGKVKRVRWLALAGVIGLGVIGLGVIGLGASGAQAQQPLAPWTAAGSTGAVDEQGKDQYFVNGPSAKIISSAPTGTRLTLRYNVTHTSGISFGDGMKLNIRYRDTGAQERVGVKLVQKNLQTGAEATPLIFNSDQHPQAFNPQFRGVSNCDGLALDFQNNVYWVEVDLFKVQGTGDPEIQGLSLGGIIC